MYEILQDQGNDNDTKNLLEKRIHIELSTKFECGKLNSADLQVEEFSEFLMRFSSSQN